LKNKSNAIIIVSLIIVVITIAAPAMTVHAAIDLDFEPFFTPADCMFDMSTDVLDDLGVECGYLTAPSAYGKPNEGTIRLGVVIIKSGSPNPKPDPLVILQGGPGGSTIDTYAEALLTTNQLDLDRDIILFDQRGTLYSEPRLACTEIDELIRDTLDDYLTDDESWQLELDAMRKCHDRLIAQGINLSDFDSLENSADIAALRKALGYNKINLYGVSYGTLLALHTIRDYPEILRSVILDAVVPTQTDFILDVPRFADRSFSKLFQACKSDPDCNQAYPDLETVFYEVINKLNNKPELVSMVDIGTGISYEALIDGATFQDGVFQMLYAGSLIPALPRMIYDGKDGQLDVFARILSIFILDTSMSYGMYYSVLCAEDSDFDINDYDLTGIRPEIAETEEGGPAQFLEICRLWEVESLDPIVDLPVSSNIPILILSGDFDPITPPENADTVAKTLENVYSIVFPSGGHGQAFEGDCQNSIIISFLKNPSEKPDISCIAKLDAPEFYTPKTMIDLPVILKLLNLQPLPILEFLILLLSIFILLSTWVAYPIAALVHRLQTNKQISERARPSQTITEEQSNPLTEADRPSTSQFKSPPTLENDQTKLPEMIRFAKLPALMSAPVLLLFFSILIYVIFQMYQNNDNRLLYGIDGSARGWFVLPLIFLILTIFMMIANFQLWRHRFWSIWGRLYYTALSLTAIICVFILFRWEILIALFQ